MRIIQIMPIPTSEDGMRLIPPKNHQEMQTHQHTKFICGMALVENEDGCRSLEWITFDRDRNIKITEDFFNAF